MSKELLPGKEKYTFDDLVEIMAILRSDGGCPWDREQTHESIRKNFIEETYEVIEAIDTKDDVLMCEELGDVLLQVAFHSRMAEEEGSFTMDDVTTGICRKLIFRHPHIFAENDSSEKTADEVLARWEELKRKEKGRKTLSDTLEGVCKSLPALMLAEKLIKKTRGLSVDPELFEGASVLSGDEKSIAEELFAICKKADALHVDCEEVLGKLCGEYVAVMSERASSGDAK